ncbi:hypothetical protein KC19_9G115800, partial [Ceratodon purpureus]
KTQKKNVEATASSQQDHPPKKKKKRLSSSAVDISFAEADSTPLQRCFIMHSTWDMETYPSASWPGTFSETEMRPHLGNDNGANKATSKQQQG